jgi:D-xylose transport system ATP-binding protein
MWKSSGPLPDVEKPRSLAALAVGGSGVLGSDRMRNETKKVLDEFHVKMKKIDDPVVNMSGGQRQGIAIGRTIYFDARVLMMDEPTAALGPEETRMVGQFIKRLKTKVSASS